MLSGYEKGIKSHRCETTSIETGLQFLFHVVAFSATGKCI
jgi:hypothetical protein